MYPEPSRHAPVERVVQVHQPAPYPPAVAVPAPVVPMQPDTVPSVASIVLPDGRVITGYAINPAHPAPVETKPAVSRTAVNIALGGVGFLAVCGGLLLLTSFIAALTALIVQLIILAAVIFGGCIALQLFTGNGHQSGTTVNIRKAVIKRNKFYG
ncbi:hypothetical protein [Streptomyces griseosporeus]|uniref:hypothetical protein n=1 Tax=Streptomyces griseosporeus TaxID=1910 RepID=UPI0036F4F5FF